MSIMIPYYRSRSSGNAYNLIALGMALKGPSKLRKINLWLRRTYKYMSIGHNQMTDDELVDALRDIATGYTGRPVLVSWGVAEDRCEGILTKLVDKQHPNMSSATNLCPNCGTDDDTAWGECDCGYLPRKHYCVGDDESCEEDCEKRGREL